MTHVQPIVLAPLEIEAAALRRVLGATTTIRVVGPRAAVLPDPAEFAAHHPVLLAGIAGGLDPRLRCGDVVVHGLDPTHPLPRGARHAAIHTAEAIATTPAEKASLRVRADADAVDMEQAIVERLLAAHGIRVIGVRAIADTAAESLPGFMNTLVTFDGRSRPLAAAGLVLRSPRTLAPMLRMARRSSVACRELARVVAAMLADPAISGPTNPDPAGPPADAAGRSGTRG